MTDRELMIGPVMAAVPRKLTLAEFTAYSRFKAAARPRLHYNDRFLLATFDRARRANSNRRATIHLTHMASGRRNHRLYASKSRFIDLIDFPPVGPQIPHADLGREQKRHYTIMKMIIFRYYSVFKNEKPINRMLIVN